MELRKPIPVEEAVELVYKHRISGKTESLSITECDNRRLAEPIIATTDVPSFEKSPYDGYAFRAIDTQNKQEDAPLTFKVVEHIGAGVTPNKTVKPGQATRIMTGAEIPSGADCVAMLEDCETYEKNGTMWMELSKQMKPNQNIVNRGSEVKEGETLVETGELINPGIIAIMATFGYSEILVAQKPLVGVLATGTELLEVDEPLEQGKIRNSNAYMITSQIKRAGGDFKYYGQLADEFEPSFKKISDVLKDVDILITTGGVSVGDFDLMPAIYEELGAEILFNKVAQRPGSVTTVAILNDTLLFGLSGNPSACYVGFELYTRPIIQHYLFNKKPFSIKTKAVMTMDFPKSNPFTRFVRSYTTFNDNGELLVHLAGLDKSNVVSSLAHTTSLMILPGGTEGFNKGDQVEVILLEDLWGQDHFNVIKETHKE